MELNKESRDIIAEMIVRHVNHQYVYPDYCDIDDLVKAIWNSCLLLDSIYDSHDELSERSRMFLFNLRKALENILPEDIVRPLED